MNRTNHGARRQVQAQCFLIVHSNILKRTLVRLSDVYLSTSEREPLLRVVAITAVFQPCGTAFSTESACATYICPARRLSTGAIIREWISSGPADLPTVIFPRCKWTILFTIWSFLYGMAAVECLTLCQVQFPTYVHCWRSRLVLLSFCWHSLGQNFRPLLVHQSTL